MKLHFDNSEIELIVDDNSYRYRAIKGEHSLTLHFSLAQHVEIPVGAWCIFEAERYELEVPSNFKRKSTRNFEFTLIMESVAAKAKKYKFRNTVDRRLKFNLTAKPREHLQMFIDNMNARDSGWTIGECIDAPEKLISYNHAFCIDALTKQADEFKTEYEFVGKKVSLHKVEYNKDTPLPLSYGKGNGFKPGVGRTNFDNSKPIEILYVQGGEDNINPSKYGSRELLLPKSAKIKYDGTLFSGQHGLNSEKVRLYITDADGLSVRREDKSLVTGEEDSLDCSHISPKRVGIISSVITVDASKNFYDIIDASIPADLNYTDCLIEGETMTVIFQSGMLTGKEFEVKYYHEAKTINGVAKAGRRFEIVPQEIDGQTMPGGAFVPLVGNTYAVYNISLPTTYICNNSTRSGASWDMFREAVKHLYENEEYKFSFTGELDGTWAKRDWLNIGGRIRLGGYILFSDNQFQPEGVAMRIVGIKDYINNPHSPEIELSNQVIGSSFNSEIGKIEENEVVVEDNHRVALQFAKRRLRDTLETMAMLQDAFSNFSATIDPIAIKTMQMLVGDISLQFVFVKSLTSTEEVAHNIIFDKTNKQLISPAGFLQHKTLGIESISSGHQANEYKTWSMSSYTSAVMTDREQKYYVYAKVSKTEKSGSFIISTTPIAIEGIAGYYHLFVGILNSEYKEDRSFVPLYGFTEILPGLLTIKKIISSDGYNFIDFLNNAARIGDDKAFLDFNTNGDRRLRLKGTLFQSESGDESLPGVFRGAFNDAQIYYVADEVSYQGSTYRCIKNTTAGIFPTNLTHWIVLAAKGEPGIGSAGPAVLYSGEFNQYKIYKGSPSRIDVVKYNDVYYKTKTTAGTFINVTPSDNSDYWEFFGSQFESLATGVLFAELANIAGLIFKNNKLISQKGQINGVESNDYTAYNFIPNIEIDGTNGEIIALGKFYSGNDVIGSVRIEGSNISVVDQRGTVMEFGIFNPGGSNEPMLRVRYREANGFNSYTVSMFGTGIVLKRENYTDSSGSHIGGSLTLHHNGIVSQGFKRQGDSLSYGDWYIDNNGYVKVFNPY